MGSREIKKAATRETLVNAAARLFAERGVEETTMDDIAREAGTSRTSVFNYFGYKERILCEIGARYIREVVAVAPMPPVGRSPRDAFAAASRMLAEVTAREPALIAAVAREMTHPDPARRRVAAEIMGYPQILRELLDRLAMAGRLRHPRQRDSYGRQLVDLISGAIIRAGGDFPLERLKVELDRAFDLFVVAALIEPGSAPHAPAAATPA